MLEKIFFLSEAEEIAEEGGEVVVDETVAELIAGGGEAAHENTAGERVEDADEADESTIEEIVIDSIVDKIAGESETI